MPTAIVVQYRTRPDAAGHNQRLIERRFEELRALQPGGLRYMAFRLADGVGFMQIAIVDGDDDPLAESAAFRRFLGGTAERLVGRPDIKSMTIVGSYRGRYIQKEHQ